MNKAPVIHLKGTCHTKHYVLYNRHDNRLVFFVHERLQGHGWCDPELRYDCDKDELLRALQELEEE